MTAPRRKQDRGRPQARTENPPLPRKVHVDGADWTYRFNRHFALIRNPERTQTFRAWMSDVGELTSDELERRLWKGGWDGIGPRHVKLYIERHLLPEMSDEGRARARWILVDVDLAVHAVALAYPDLHESRLDILDQWYCVLGSGVEWTRDGVLDVGEGDDRIFRAALRVYSGHRAKLAEPSPQRHWYPMSERFTNLLHVPDNATPPWVAAARETALAIIDTAAPPGADDDRDVRDHRRNVELAKLALQRLSRFDPPQRNTP